jgi:hypothetical protein
MKKIIFTCVLLAFTALSYAQTYTVPAASPKQTIEQQFSISNIKVEYGRPAVKGRKIFGELVPFGKIWRTGANNATKLTINQKVLFGDKQLMPGEYALFVIPNAKQWQIILNKDANAWGAYTYDEKQNVLETVVSVQNTPTFQEYLEIKMDPKNDNLVHLVITWEKTKIEIPIQVSNIEATNDMIKMLQDVKQIQREANKKSL